MIKVELPRFFSNLLSNAIKFTPEGHHVLIGMQRDLNCIIFSVKDTGHGISSEDLPHIFNRYWQGKKISRESIGLGLAISKAIIESHGGKMWVESQKEMGTAFYFTLLISP